MKCLLFLCKFFQMKLLIFICLFFFSFFLCSQDSLDTKLPKRKISLLSAVDLHSDKINFGFGFGFDTRIKPSFSVGFRYLTSSNYRNNYKDFDLNKPPQEYVVTYSKGENHQFGLTSTYYIKSGNSASKLKLGFINGLGFKMMTTQRNITSSLNSTDKMYFEYQEEQKVKSVTLHSGVLIEYRIKKSAIVLEVPMYFELYGVENNQINNVRDNRTLKVQTTHVTTNGFQKFYSNPYITLGYSYNF